LVIQWCDDGVGSRHGLGNIVLAGRGDSGVAIFGSDDVCGVRIDPAVFVGQIVSEYGQGIFNSGISGGSDDGDVNPVGRVG